MPPGKPFAGLSTIDQQFKRRRQVPRHLASARIVVRGCDGTLSALTRALMGRGADRNQIASRATGRTGLSKIGIPLLARHQCSSSEADAWSRSASKLS
jgi:hypothetical protein